MALNDLGEQNDDWFGQNAPPTPQKSFGNPTLRCHRLGLPRSRATSRPAPR
jgi:hypothetical protein